MTPSAAAETRYSTAAATFHIAQGRVLLNQVLLVGRDEQLEMDGTVNFARQLDLRVRPVPRDLTPRDLARTAEIDAQDTDADTWAIVGTLEAPQVRLQSPVAGGRERPGRRDRSAPLTCAAMPGPFCRRAKPANALRHPVAILLVIAGQASAAAQQSKAKNKKKGNRTCPGVRPSAPKLIPGEVMRYQVEFQTTSDTKSGGAVQDPEGPSHVVIIWDARIRLEVLSGPAIRARARPLRRARPARPARKARRREYVRLRTTYEQSSATVQSDTPDPQSEAIVKQYQQLEGHSIEFTLGPDGNVPP